MKSIFNKPINAPLVVMTLLSATALTAADAVNPHIQLLKSHGIEPTAASIGRLLQSLHPNRDSIQRQAELIRQLGDCDFLRRERAMRELLQMPVVSYDLLRRVIDGDDPETRWRAKKVLDRVQQRSEARINTGLVIASLSVIRDRELKGLAAAVLQTVPLCQESRAETVACEALQATALRSDADLLRRSLNAESVAVRIASLSALNSLLGAKANADLAPLLDDANDRVRIEAAWTLANHGHRKTLNTFANLLDSSDLRIRARSAHALRSLTGRRFKFVAYREAQRRAEAVNAWKGWLATKGPGAELTFPIRQTSALIGHTLVCLRNSDRVIELDADGEKVWETRIAKPCGCHGLLNGHRLIASYSDRKVVEYDADGLLVWERTGLPGRPFSVRRLDNGNTLVACTSGRLVVEISSSGRFVWHCRLGGEPMDARRLANGHTLIALQKANQVVEVDSSGKVVWDVSNLRTPRSVQPLPNGNILVSEAGGGRVVEINRNRKIVWSQSGLQLPCDAQRLANGQTLIADSRGPTIFDRKGKTIWKKQGNDTVAICRF